MFIVPWMLTLTAEGGGHGIVKGRWAWSAALFRWLYSQVCEEKGGGQSWWKMKGRREKRQRVFSPCSVWVWRAGEDKAADGG